MTQYKLTLPNGRVYDISAVDDDDAKDQAIAAQSDTGVDYVTVSKLVTIATVRGFKAS